MAEQPMYKLSQITFAKIIVQSDFDTFTIDRIDDKHIAITSIKGYGPDNYINDYRGLFAAIKRINLMIKYKAHNLMYKL